MVHMAVAAVHTHSQELTDQFHGRSPTNDEKIIVRAQEDWKKFVSPNRPWQIPQHLAKLPVCLDCFCVLLFTLVFILNIIDMMGEDLCQMLNMLCY